MELVKSGDRVMALRSKSGNEFRPARRVQESLLASCERKALLWLAERTPAAVNSDHLTLLGFLSLIATGACYAAARWWPPALVVGIAFLALNWLGDSLDGTLARYRNRQRPRYGFYVDHVSDSVGATFLLGGLALSGYMSPGIAAGLLISFLLLSINSYLATYCRGTFQLSQWGMSPTELRVLLAAGNVALLYRPLVTLGEKQFLLFDVGGAVGIAGMALMLAASVVGHTRALYREEKLP